MIVYTINSNLFSSAQLKKIQYEWEKPTNGNYIVHMEIIEHKINEHFLLYLYTGLIMTQRRAVKKVVLLHGGFVNLETKT